MSQLQCPACGAEMSLDVVLSHEALRRATFELLQMSLPLGALVMRDVALFRPAKNRMGADRMAKLVAQLLPDMQRQAITHRGRDWDMPLEGWRAGFEAMLEKAAADKLTLPLKSHGYLMEIIVGYGNKAEAAKETKREQDRAYPYSTDRNSNTAAPIGDVISQVISRQIPAEAREQLMKLGALKAPKKES